MGVFSLLLTKVDVVDIFPKPLAKVLNERRSPFSLFESIKLLFFYMRLVICETFVLIDVFTYV